MTWRTFDDEVVSRLDQIQAMLEILLRKETDMGTDLTALRDKVTKIETVGNSMKETMLGLAAQIADLKTDPAALQALADELNATADDWAAAVAANTPSA